MDDFSGPMTGEPAGDAERRHLLAAEWRTAIEPLDRQAQEANVHAVALGAVGLRALFVLNGGALLVFPAYLGLLGIDLDSAFRLIFLAGVGFLTGLIFAALGTLLAYFAEASRGRLAFHGKQAVLSAMRDSYRAAQAVEPVAQTGIEKYRAQAARTAKISRRLRVAAIVVAVFSLAFFAAGAFFSAAAVMTGPSPSDETGASTV